jgi:hypothetical protein
MLRLGRDFGWTLVLAAGLLLLPLELAAQTSTTMPQATAPPAQSVANPASTAPASSAPSAGRRHKKEKATPVAAVPQPPPIPPTLEQTPPTPPRITYQGGQLSIDARNSTLAQVLRAVQSQTGASMEIPASASNERVVTQLGPGQPKDVLNSLLNGSKFDYIILGVTGNPGAVQKVILTSRQNSGPNVNVAQNNNQPQSPEADDEAQAEEVVPVNEAEENPTPEQPLPPGGRHRPMMMSPGGQANQPPASNPEMNSGDQSNGAKTPEQLMQELQQMQQQQQQYQQQLNPANQNQPQ